MKRALLFLFSSALLLSPAARAEEIPVFEDLFAGVETRLPDGSYKLYPDRQKWAFTFWPGIKWPDSYGDGTNWLDGNDESQAYLSPFLHKVKDSVIPYALRYDPFSIGKDGLHIKADRLTHEQQEAYQVGGHRRFGSGIILSRESFLYGKIRVVAKLPSAAGSWPAIWLLPVSHEWPPEIDILEGMAWGPHKTEIHSGLIGRKEENAGFAKWFAIGADPGRDFHEYGLDWDKDSIAAFFDGRELWRRPTPPSMQARMYLLINLAVGGKWPYNELGVKPIDGRSPERLSKGADMIEKDYPAEMIVKSVRIMK